MTLEPIGDIADVSLTGSTPTTSERDAQNMARRENPIEATEIEADSNVSANKAQMYARRVEETWP